MTVHVVHNAVNIQEGHYEQAHTYAQRHAKRIFNPDSRRRQVRLKPSHKIVKSVTSALQKHGFMYGRTAGTSVLIHSESGCKRQQWHTDYKPQAISNLRKKPLGVLVALTDNTLFDTPAQQFTLKCGDMLVFDGDEVHAGSSYNTENTRFHMYIDTPTHTRIRNRTYFAKIKNTSNLSHSCL